MKTRVVATLFAAGLLFPLSGCADGNLSEGDAPEILEVVGSPALEGELPRGIYMVIDAELQAEAQAQTDPDVIYAGEPTIIFMNKQGGVYTPGFNDSRNNVSSIPGSTAQIPAWAVSAAGWSEVMTCVRDLWSPFNVTITDVDPGQTPHFESVVAGHPNDLGLPSGVGGVSPFTSDCSTINNSIVFTFAEVYGTNYRAICETVAQEVAHSFGLDHEYYCQDPMTYLGGCGGKSFQNVAAQCGENGPRTCACGGGTQNSVEMLLARIGPSGPGLPPDVTITRPQSGATVGPGFIVEAAITAAQTDIEQVELYIDGTLRDTGIVAPYIFNAPMDLSTGDHVVETRARDISGSEGSAQVSVTVQQDGDPDPDPDPDPNPGDGDLIGGCNVGGGSDQSFALILLGLGLFLVRRRR